jgi:hypothetical protein
MDALVRLGFHRPTALQVFGYGERMLVRPREGSLLAGVLGQAEQEGG